MIRHLLLGFRHVRHSAPLVLTIACLMAFICTMIGPSEGALAAERGAPSKIKLPKSPQWRSGSISRDESGRLFVDTSARSLAPVDPKRYAFLKDYKASGVSSCLSRKTPVHLERRAPAHVRSIVQKLAPQYGLDPHLVLAVIAVESNFHSAAVSPKNAQGLMQLIPDTAKRFGVRDPFNPADNIRGGMLYLRWLLKTFNGDLSLALAGYNAGENAVQKYRGIPPYNETRQYVKKVHALYGCNGGSGKGVVEPAATAPAGGEIVSGWPTVREPYDLWNAANSSIDRADNGRCRFRLGRNPDQAGTSMLICR